MGKLTRAVRDPKTPKNKGIIWICVINDLDLKEETDDNGNAK